VSARQPSKEEWAAVVAEARNPSERAVLCALAKFANRTNGVVQEPRAALAATATMSIASFRHHAAALARKERGILAATTLRHEDGGYEQTIYTLIGWLHLRGKSEPCHLQLAPLCQNLAEGSANVSQGGAPDFSRGGVIKSDTGVGENLAGGLPDFDPPHKTTRDARADSNPLKIVDNNTSTPLSARPRGSDGGLMGDAGDVVAIVNHRWLDPSKDQGLVLPAGRMVAAWRRLGLEVDEIAAVIADVLARREARNPSAARINTWNFFDSAVREHAALKQRTQSEEMGDVTSGGGAGPKRSYAEQQLALARARRSSWGPVLDERRGGAS
jgi:hypothetical protein